MGRNHGRKEVYSSESESDCERNQRKERRQRRRSPSCSSESSSCSSSSSVSDWSDIEPKVEHEIKQFEKCEREPRLRYYYNRIVKRLRREPFLMANGADAYGAFFATTVRTYNAGDKIIFENSNNVLNLTFTAGTGDITIQRDGIYFYTFTGSFNEPAQLTVFINDVPQPDTTTSSNSGTHPIKLHQLLKVKKGDIVSVRDYQSNTPITTAINASGTITPTQNIDFVLWRIAPYPEPCCFIPPKLMCNDNCYWSCGDSDSDSDCDKECKPCKPKKKSSGKKHDKKRDDKKRENKQE